MIKYGVLTLAVMSLCASAYLAYARFVQKKRTDTIPLYVSIGLTVALFGLALVVSKTPIEYTPIEGSWGSDTMREYLKGVSKRVGLRSPTNYDPTQEPLPEQEVQ